MTRAEMLRDLGWREMPRGKKGGVYLIDDLERIITRYPSDATIGDVLKVLYDNMDVDAVKRAHTMLEGHGGK